MKGATDDAFFVPSYVFQLLHSKLPFLYEAINKVQISQVGLRSKLKLCDLVHFGISGTDTLALLHLGQWNEDPIVLSHLGKVGFS